MKSSSTQPQEKSTPIHQQRGQVEVLTWGTRFDGGTGLQEQISAKLKGGNVGHAALRITVPVDDESKSLVEKYCRENGKIVLPYKIKKQSDGTEVFEIYVSAWPKDKKHLTVDRSYEQDSIDERSGVHFEWSEKARDQFKPDTRSYKGITSRTTMILGPSVILHKRKGVSESEYKRINDIILFKNYLKEKENYNFLKERINNTDKLHDTERILLDRLIPTWGQIIKNPPKISDDERNSILIELESQKTKFIASNTNVIDMGKMHLSSDYDNIISRVESDIKKWGRISYDTADLIGKNRFALGISIQDSDPVRIMNYDLNQARELVVNIRSLKKNMPIHEMEAHYQYFTLEGSTPLNDGIYTPGTSPDHVVKLPIGDQSTQGLDFEGMLIRARQVATSDERFSLSGTNCSKVAGWVLYAGAANHKERDIFDRKALNTYATPQMVLNNALKFLRKTSKKANDHYFATAELERDSSKSQKKSRDRVAAALSLTEITLEKDEHPLTASNCKSVLDRFEKALNDNKEIPYLSANVKLAIENAIRDDPVLQDRFFKLCERAIIMANKQHSSLQNTTTDEWDIAKNILQDQKSHGLKGSRKISKKDFPDLKHSYMVLTVNGKRDLFRVSADILGKGTQGKVKIIVNQRGERFAVKIQADNPSLDAEVAVMKQAGALHDEFTRKRETKFSKSLNSQIGDKRYIIQPLHKGRELAKVLQDKQKMSEQQKILLALKCAEAVKDIHALNLIHRDIKAENFVVDIDDKGNINSVNIIDFGGGIKPDQSGVALAKAYGSPGFMSPELGKADKNKLAGEWMAEVAKAKQLGDLLIDAKKQIDVLDNVIRSTKGEVNHNKNELLKYAKSKLSKKEYAELKNLLGDFDKLNHKERIQLLSSIDTGNEKIKYLTDELVTSENKLHSLSEQKQFYEQKAIGLQVDYDNANTLAQDKKRLMREEFSKPVPNSYASDVYAYGIMLQHQFGLNLAKLGLSAMLSDDPKLRPSMETVLQRLQKLSNVSTLASTPPTTTSDPIVEMKSKIDNLKQQIDANKTDDKKLLECRETAKELAAQVELLKSTNPQSVSELQNLLTQAVKQIQVYFEDIKSAVHSPEVRVEESEKKSFKST